MAPRATRRFWENGSGGLPVPELFCLGFGYSAQALARRLRERGWGVSGTVRSETRVAAVRENGFDAFAWAGDAHSKQVAEGVGQATHLLLSAPPDEAGDPLLTHHRGDLEQSPSLAWIGYLSTVGVYGNHDGLWISESAALNTTKKRGRRRVEAERAWLDFGNATGMAVQVFRLAGIYGPERSAIDKLKSGQARRIVKPGQVFNRIHVVDIVTTLEASIDHPNPGAIYNVCDDEPAPPQDLVTFAAGLLNVDPPPEVAFDDAELTPMARSFYGENKRISNARIKDELGVTLAFPNYRDGLRAIMVRSAPDEPVESGS